MKAKNMHHLTNVVGVMRAVTLNPGHTAGWHLKDLGLNPCCGWAIETFRRAAKGGFITEERASRGRIYFPNQFTVA
jgi:hypothetical protein